MKKEDLIKLCRYYKGEKSNPYKGKDLEHIWFYEYYWVESMLKEKNELDFFLKEYIYAGLSDFCKDDNVPITLKAILYNRHAQHNEMFDIVSYKDWYMKYSH